MSSTKTLTKRQMRIAEYQAEEDARTRHAVADLGEVESLKARLDAAIAERDHARKLLVERDYEDHSKSANAWAAARARVNAERIAADRALQAQRYAERDAWAQRYYQRTYSETLNYLHKVATSKARAAIRREMGLPPDDLIGAPAKLVSREQVAEYHGRPVYVATIEQVVRGERRVHLEAQMGKATASTPVALLTSGECRDAASGATTNNLPATPSPAY